MTLYLNGSKIKENSSYGLRFNGSNIIKAYFNGSLVYQYQSYAPSTLLTTITNNNTYNVTLPIGVYQLHITGGGGGYANWGAGGYPWAAGGGSAATWEGTFYNPTSQNITLYAGAAEADSYMNLGGTRMITAGRGGHAGVDSGGAAGTLTVGSTLDIVSTSKSTNGNRGPGTTFGWSQTGAASTSSNGWGGGTVLQSGNVQYGGAKLWYIRYSK